MNIAPGSRLAMRGERLMQFDSTMYFLVGRRPGIFGTVQVNIGGALTPMFQLGAAGHARSDDGSRTRGCGVELSNRH